MIDQHNELFGRGRDDFFPQECTASALDQVEGGIDLIGAVNGNVLIYVHKELELDDLLERYPADHYVLIDDKLRILAAIKKALDRRVTTVFPRQGHYAADPKALANYPPADISIVRIGDLVDFSLQDFLGVADAADGLAAIA